MLAQQPAPCARAARSAPRRASVAPSASAAAPADKAVSRRSLALSGAAALLAASLTPASPARAFLGFGEKSAEEVYAEDTGAIISSTRELLALTKDDPALADKVSDVRRQTNQWVAKYRRNDNFIGRASYGNTYSALNAVAGHYNNFGTKYIFPAKRAERVMKELSDAEQLLTRGR